MRGRGRGSKSRRVLAKARRTPKTTRGVRSLKAEHFQHPHGRSRRAEAEFIKENALLVGILDVQGEEIAQGRRGKGEGLAFISFKLYTKLILYELSYVPCPLTYFEIYI